MATFNILNTNSLHCTSFFKNNITFYILNGMERIHFRIMCIQLCLRIIIFVGKTRFSIQHITDEYRWIDLWITSIVLQVYKLKLHLLVYWSNNIVNNYSIYRNIMFIWKSIFFTLKWLKWKSIDDRKIDL